MLARFAIRNGKVIVFVVLVLALLGVRAYLQTSAGIFPVMTFARVDVVADAGTLPPDRVRVAVSDPLERALQAVPGVTGVVATSSRGSADLSVSFTAATEPRVALAAVDEALARARSDVPAAASIVAESVSSSREPIVGYALVSKDLSQAVLRQLATTQIVPRLYGTPGLGRVSVSGGATAEYRIALDPARLAASGIGAADVEKALADASDVRSVGTAEHGYQTYTVLVDAALRDAASLASVRVPLKSGDSVAVGSIGSVAFGVGPVASETSFDGAPAVVISAYAPAGSDSVATARELAKRIASLVPSLPRNVTVRAFWNQTTLVVESQAALRDAIVIGALLAIAVIFAFLRDLRLTLVAAAVIPLAIAIALLALQLAGQTLNLMSVGGLAVAVGLIIDDAIVVIEGVARERHEDPHAGADLAIERTMTRLAGPMIASTATTVVVFLPLSILGGVTGFFFRALAFTLSASLVVSLGLALFVTPILTRTFLRGEREREGHGSPERVLHRYDDVLRWALGHRIAVAVASIGILVVTAVLLASLPSDFLPKLDEGQFEIGYTLPVGTSLAASDAAARDMERTIAADPAVASVAGLTGLDSNGVTPTQPNIGALRVRLKPPGERDRYEVVAARLRDRLSATVPASIFDFRQILEDLIADLSGDTAPIEITLRGTDQATIATLAARVADRIGHVRGVVDAASGIVYDGPTVRVAPRGAALAALGIVPGDVGDALAALGRGNVATTVPGPLGLVPVRVAVSSAPGNATVPNESTRAFVAGGPATLGTIASLSTQRVASDIVTQNGQIIDRVTAGTEGASLSSVSAGIREKLASFAFPSGYSAELGGQAASQARSFAEFANVIGLAVVLVFAVMLATFRSFRIPLVILTAVPLALIGVALGLAVTRTAFNVSSFMGLLLLVGIVVKNGILLIDSADRRRADGASMTDALIGAGNARLRPIVMTTLAAIGGLLPLAFGIGQGAEMEKPLAIAVIGGLSTATLFTLVVIPVIYAAFAGTSPRGVATRVVPAVATIAFVVWLPHDASAQSLAAGASFPALSLDAASHAALATSPDVLGAKAALDERRADLAAARSAIAPSLVANYAQVPQGNPPGPNVVSRQIGTIVQFSVGDFIAYSPGVRRAALAYAAADASERAAELNERVVVAGLYFDALKARALAGAARDAAALADAQRDAARLRFAAGDAARLDVTRADVESAKARAALELAIATDENATAALQSETGASEDAFATTAGNADAGAPASPPDPQAAIALARANRPEIASARALADAASAEFAQSRASAFPAVTVGAGYLTGTDSGVPIDAPTVVANLTLPLGSGARDRVAAAKARVVAAGASAASVERKILADVASAARTLRASYRASEATSSERDAARDEVRATELGYRSGASSSLEVTIARSAYAQAVVDALSAQFDLAKARATLEIEEGR